MIQTAEVTFSPVLHLPPTLIFTFLRKNIYLFMNAPRRKKTYLNEENLSGKLGVTDSTHFSCGNYIVLHHHGAAVPVSRFASAPSEVDNDDTYWCIWDNINSRRYMRWISSDIGSIHHPVTVNSHKSKIDMGSWPSIMGRVCFSHRCVWKLNHTQWSPRFFVCFMSPRHSFSTQAPSQCFSLTLVTADLSSFLRSHTVFYLSS